MTTIQPVQHRNISEIARDIRKAWPNPYFAAKPYLEAMLTLTTIDSKYGYDSARITITYFLSNASSFRGAEARALKAELKAIIA